MASAAIDIRVQRDVKDRVTIMVAPALQVHPATDTLLRYISPQIDWTLLGIDERWRKELKAVFRKRRGDIG